MKGHSRWNLGIQIGSDLNTQEYRLIQFFTGRDKQYRLKMQVLQGVGTKAIKNQKIISFQK